MAEKSRDAFRTISEVADWLDVPTHVLRFWESRFSQIKPVKRAGGRRYYRPSDMRIIGGVKVLLHDQGMTIRGVQKLIREEGLKHISSFSPDLYAEDADPIGVETKAPLDQDALEKAARPAPAARTTREAEPDPITDGTAEEETTTEVVFRRASKPAPTAPSDEPELAFLPRTGGKTEEPAAPAESTEPAAPAQDSEPVAEAEAPAPAIPATPEVHQSDPADDDADHDRGAGIAARLALASRAHLEANRATIREAAERLRALLDRAS